jgi:CBS domain-containing protein
MWASSGDLAKLRAHTAGEAMTAPALTIEPSQPVAEAARRMVDRGVNRLPVVED